MASPTKPRMSAEEKRWRAQTDVSTLAAAEQIKADRGRHGAALTEANRQASALNKIASGRGQSKQKK